MIKKDPQRLMVFVIIGLYLLASIIWEFSSNAPWDDDCVGKYYNAKEAINNPKQFISLWNRPLFIIVFFLPFQISKHAILLMSVISAASAYFLYLSALKLKMKNALLVVPLLLFQAFFFTISKSALAEPLAAAIICFGVYFYVHKRFLAFALIGSLLPLARLELAVFLGIWAFILLREQKLKYILLLAVPSILWSLAGTLLTGETLWLYEQTLGKENSTNRYGHTDFWHYFVRYIYVIGPVVFYFFTIGLVENLFRKKSRLIITGQFLLGFGLYVLFSWKLNLGQAAGFLRHLITLSPLAAILAVEGYNYWIESLKKSKGQDSLEGLEFFNQRVLEKEKEMEAALAEIQAQNEGKKAREIRNLVNKKKKEFENWKIKEGQMLKAKPQQKDGTKKAYLRILVHSMVLCLLSYFLFSKELVGHHNFGEAKDYSNLIIIASLTFLLIGFKWIFNQEVIKMATRFGMSILIVFVAMGYTLITEKPDGHNSPERIAMTNMSQLYYQSRLNGLNTFVNHPWFFWANNVDRDRDRYKVLTKESIEAAPVNSVIIWENHYGRRLAGDVELDYFKGKTQFVELVRNISSDKKFASILFLKVDPANTENLSDYFDNLISLEKNNTSLFLNRGNHRLNRLKKKQEALLDYNESLRLDSANADAHFNRGIILFNQKKYEEALTSFNSVTKLNATYKPALLNAATSAVRIGDNKEALRKYNAILKLDPKHKEIYYNRGVVKMRLNKRKAGCKDLQKAFELGYKEAKATIDAYCK